MKRHPLLGRFALSGAVLFGPANALAQDSPVIHGDASGLIGLQSVNAAPSGLYNSGFENTFSAGISSGWHWTDHLKTEIDFDANTRATAYSASELLGDGQPTYVGTDRAFSRRTLGIGQQYQFFHNAWFHPHLAAGANLTWERSTLHVNPIVIYDRATNSSRVIAPARSDPPRTTLRVNPFVQTGFKAYITQAAFFRSDLRLAFRGGVDEVVIRFGFGVDF